MTSPARHTVARLAAEARRVETPELRWERIEAALIQRIEKEERASSRRARAPLRRVGSVLWPLLAGVGIAALVALWWRARAPGSQASLEPAALETAVARTVDGEGLPAGARLSSEDRSVTVRHAGHARWVLAPESEAVLESRGEVVEVRLVAGRLTASVEPQPRTETFVVIAGDARVAVHGTEFSVELSTRGVDVSVSRGSVRVSSLGNHHPPQLLRAPSERRFEPPRASESEGFRPAPARGEDSEPTSVAHAPRTRRSVAARALGSEAREHYDGGSLQQEPTVDQLERGIDSITAALEECLLENTTPGQEVRLMFDSTLMLEVGSSGAVVAHAFDPPLAPEVETCSRSAIGAVRFAPSQRGLKVLRRLELSR